MLFHQNINQSLLAYAEAYKYGQKLDAKRSRRHFYTCVEGMEEKVTNQLNKDITMYEKILPTDYKSPEYGSIMPVEDSNIWLYYN
ncbi:MAG: hypothetical protein O7175_05495 [Wolbachia endosymbiont of Lasioglossum nitidulum]|nr:hypothetical protein [Wolbachia endosymbiont of Lasioglossum nitidulum]MDX5561272.1 hypothetical protein [Wolbachia endosymbiont of Andrena bicolor]